jgi:hypothetical protein
MDPEFQRALIIVLVAGSLIGGAGALALFLIFRRFEGAGAGGTTHIALMVALIAFVLVSCLALFALSYSAR